MTYERAKKYLDEHVYVINQQYQGINNPFIITDLLIAPKIQRCRKKLNY